MIKSLKTIMRQDRERYVVPRRVQDVIPIQAVWEDGIFRVGNKFSKTYRFTDINYFVASREDKESMFLTYSELLNSLDSAATTKLTICNRRQSQADFEQSVLMSMRGDGLDKYRKEYNQMIVDKATEANSVTQDKYVTVTIYKKKVQEVMDRGSIYFGENAISHNLIMCNKVNLLNQASFRLGVPGSGKSFSVKEEIAFLILNMRRPPPYSLPIRRSPSGTRSLPTSPLPPPSWIVSCITAP